MDHNVHIPPIQQIGHEWGRRLLLVKLPSPPGFIACGRRAGNRLGTTRAPEAFPNTSNLHNPLISKVGPQGFEPWTKGL